jgi:hypothetical protein
VRANLPAPADYQPEGGGTTLLSTGGKIDKSYTRNYVDQYVFDHRHVSLFFRHHRRVLQNKIQMHLHTSFNST